MGASYRPDTQSRRAGPRRAAGKGQEEETSCQVGPSNEAAARRRAESPTRGLTTNPG